VNGGSGSSGLSASSLTQSRGDTNICFKSVDTSNTAHSRSFSGIWDCLSSQQVVDFVRYQVFKGKELTQICEMIFEHCLAQCWRIMTGEPSHD